MASDDKKRLLLLSTSTVFGGAPFDYAEAEIRGFLGGVKEVIFVPFAIADWDGYSERTKALFAEMGLSLRSLHQVPTPEEAIEAAEAIFVGGGNTFRLLKTLQALKLLELIRGRAGNGMRYMGSSAGSNLAGPTIMTTNDMPIVQPASFEALGLVPFQINPHYLDPDPDSKHMGETREARIVQFLEENETAVIGLREGGMIKVERGVTRLLGLAGARVFRKGKEPLEVKPNTLLDEFLG